MTLISSISGIRGTIGGKPEQALTPDDIVSFTAAYGTWLLNSGKKPKVVVGRDGRISGPMVSAIVCNTLISLGISVIDIGLSTTPTVEIAVTYLEAGGGIIITASHNPKNWNALKLLNDKGEFLNGEEGNHVLQIARSRSYEYQSVDHLGSYQTRDDLIQIHIDQILALPLVDKTAIHEAGFKVVVDTVNSTGGIAVPELLKALGVQDVTMINGNVDGKFHHNPEPLPENLFSLSSEVVIKKADIGIAVDPDVDRLALVQEDGEFYGEEYTLVTVADYILQNTPGNTVSNLSSTRALEDVTLKHGGSYKASAVGEVNVVQAMKETNAIIGGEGNGGVIYPELHYGRDALVGIALLLTFMAKTDKPLSQIRNKYPVYQISKNKVTLKEGTNVDEILVKIKDLYKKYPINDIDGVRIDFDKDWVHLRKSNTEPIIRIYAESQSMTRSENLAKKIITDIKEML